MSNEDNIFKSKKLTYNEVRLIELFSEYGKSLDSLPYTESFDKMFEQAKELQGIHTERELLSRLLRLRKSGRLPRLDKYEKPSNVVPERYKEQLQEIFRSHIEDLSVRENIPYTDAFDKIASRVKDVLDQELDPQDVWRILIQLTK